MNLFNCDHDLYNFDDYVMSIKYEVCYFTKILLVLKSCLLNSNNFKVDLTNFLNLFKKKGI